MDQRFDRIDYEFVFIFFYRLAANRKVLRLNIPLSRGIDSLNTGMAAAVIAFEIRKQLLQAWTKIKQDRIMAENQGI